MKLTESELFLDEREAGGISAATEKGKTMENEVKCPECGGEPEVLYVNKAGEIVGCEFCLKAKYWFEVEV